MSERDGIMKNFKNAKKGIISSCRCLAEGVDVPVVDMVAFCDSKRSEIDILDLRVSIEKNDSWALTLWGKNALDEKYNAEWSPGPAAGFNFLWPALPARFGLDFTMQF